MLTQLELHSWCSCKSCCTAHSSLPTAWGCQSLHKTRGSGRRASSNSSSSSSGRSSRRAPSQCGTRGRRPVHAGTVTAPVVLLLLPPPLLLKHQPSSTPTHAYHQAEHAQPSAAAVPSSRAVAARAEAPTNSQQHSKHNCRLHWHGP